MFDESGRHVSTIGGEGEGPGEFVRLSWLGRTDGDTLVTFDSRLRRASWFTDGGQLVQTLRIDPWAEEPANATRFGVMTAEPLGVAPGRLLIRAEYARRGAKGEYRDTFSLALSDQSGSLEPLGRYPGAELYYGRSGGAFATLAPTFGRDTYVAESGSRIVVGSSDRFELDVYDEAFLQMKVVAEVTLDPVTDTEVESWRQGWRESAADTDGEFGEAARMAIENAPARRTPPAFRQLAVDSEHSIWVARPHRLPDASSSWIVLAADGTPEASVEVPPDVEILEVGETYVVGLRRNDADVEQIVLYELQRTRPD